MLGEEFLSLSLDQVCTLISSDKLTVSSEEKVRFTFPPVAGKQLFLEVQIRLGGGVEAYIVCGAKSSSTDPERQRKDGPSKAGGVQREK